MFIYFDLCPPIIASSVALWVSGGLVIQRSQVRARAGADIFLAKGKKNNCHLKIMLALSK